MSCGIDEDEGGGGEGMVIQFGTVTGVEDLGRSYQLGTARGGPDLQ